MTGLRIVVLCSGLAAAVLAMGCEKTSAFCNDHPDDVGCGGSNTQPDGNTGEGCTETCSGDTPVCDKPDDVCVVCLTNDDCDAANPICSDVGGMHGSSCHACEKPDDCDSHACLPTGQCADATQVRYAKDGGDDGGACDFAAPCGTIKGALGKSPSHTAVVLGAMTEHVPATKTDVITIVGGTTNASIGFNNTILSADGGSLTAANLELHLSNQFCAETTNMGGTLVLDRVNLDACTMGGVHGAAGSVTITRSSIHDNAGLGILLDAQTTGYTITNTYILSNGNSASLIGGAAFTGGSGLFAFNTVIGNHTAPGATKAAGIDCSAGMLSNNIIVGNTRFGGTTPVDIGGACTLGGKNISNVDLSTLGLDENLHLTAASTDAIDQVTTSLTTDNKGLIRPQGDMADVGADELRQNP